MVYIISLVDWLIFKVLKQYEYIADQPKQTVIKQLKNSFKKCTLDGYKIPEGITTNYGYLTRRFYTYHRFQVYAAQQITYRADYSIIISVKSLSDKQSKIICKVVYNRLLKPFFNTISFLASIFCTISVLYFGYHMIITDSFFRLIHIFFLLLFLPLTYLSYVVISVMFSKEPDNFDIKSLENKVNQIIKMHNQRYF